MNVKSLSEKLLFGSIKIETIVPTGISSGTGFIFLTYSSTGEKEYYVVTNKHVVKNAISGTLRFILKDSSGNPDLQNAISYKINNFEKQWFGYDNIIEDEITNDTIDVAIIPFEPIFYSILKQTGKEIYFGSPRLDNIPTQEDIDNTIDVIENILFIGYPNGLIDEYNNTPIVRKGITATPYSLDFNNQKKFLVDASVFGGSSGSPVYLFQEGIYKQKGTNKMIMSDKFFFLGIINSVFSKYEQRNLKAVPIQTTNSLHKWVSINRQTIDLGVVFKPDTILETIAQYKEFITLPY